MGAGTLYYFPLCPRCLTLLPAVSRCSACTCGVTSGDFPHVAYLTYLIPRVFPHRLTQNIGFFDVINGHNSLFFLNHNNVNNAIPNPLFLSEKIKDSIKQTSQLVAISRKVGGFRTARLPCRLRVQLPSRLSDFPIRSGLHGLCLFVS